VDLPAATIPLLAADAAITTRAYSRSPGFKEAIGSANCHALSRQPFQFNRFFAESQKMAWMAANPTARMAQEEAGQSL
jgi:hypothetical protein